MHPDGLELGEHLGEEAGLGVDPQHGAAARSRVVSDQRLGFTLLKLCLTRVRMPEHLSGNCLFAFENTKLMRVVQL